MMTTGLRWVMSIAWLLAIACGSPPRGEQASAGAGGGAGMEPQRPPASFGGAGGAGAAAAGAGAAAGSAAGMSGTPAADGGAAVDAGADATTAVALEPLPFECAPDRWASNRVDVGDVSLHVACRAQDAGAPLIVLLHG